MLRLFAALPVPTDITEALQPLQQRLSGASWRPVGNFHITLRFFGEIDHALAAELDEAIGEIPARQFALALQGVGWFGRREPYSVWARIAPCETLDALAGACERVARRAGLPAERRPYRPHVTLAYCHGTPLEAAMAWADRNGAFSAGPWTADRFHLYSSHLGRGPSRYTAEADYPLA